MQQQPSAELNRERSAFEEGEMDEEIEDVGGIGGALSESIFKKKLDVEERKEDVDQKLDDSMFASIMGAAQNLN